VKGRLVGIHPAQRAEQSGAAVPQAFTGRWRNDLQEIAEAQIKGLVV
jgi:hypothetical protein